MGKMKQKYIDEKIHQHNKQLVKEAEKRNQQDKEYPIASVADVKRLRKELEAKLHNEIKELQFFELYLLAMYIRDMKEEE